MHARLILTPLALLVALLFAGAAAAESPQMNTPASISGNAAVGQQLTAHNGTWLYADGTSCQSDCHYSYQWQRCVADGSSCTDIGGAVGRFYTVQAADGGSRLRTMETVTKHDCNAHGVDCRDVSKSAPSGMTAVVAGSAPSGPTPPAAPVPPAAPAPQAPIPPTATAAPTVTGLAMVDEMLTATQGSWSGSPTLRTEWLRCDASGGNCEGLGITTGTSKVIPVDIGKTLRVKVTGSNLAAAREALSDPTPVVSELKPTAERPWLEAARVLAPHRLVISAAVARPARLVRPSRVTLRLTVTDTRGFRISGALVTAVVLPRTALGVPAEATTAEDGTASLTFGAGRLAARLKSVTLVVTARRPSDRLTSPRAALVRVKLAVAAAKRPSRR